MDSKILNIAVLTAGIDEEYQQNIIKGINEYAGEKNINIFYFTAYGGVLANSNYDKGEYNIFNLVNYSRFDGIIFMDNTIGALDVRKKVSEQIKNANIPAVVFDSESNPEFYNIKVDNFKAMEDVIKHVIKEHGAKKINYVSGPMENPESRQRYEAYKSVLSENGIEFEKERVYFGEFRSIDGIHAANEILDSDLEFPDAIICANDAMALTVIITLEKHGLKIPDDVIVTGFDNISAARYFCPELTTVDRPLKLLGRKACEIIQSVYNGEDIQKNHTVFTNPVFSESCGCGSQDFFQEEMRNFKKETYNKIENCNYHISILNRMTSALADSESLENHSKIINTFLSEIKCDDFYICLGDNWEGCFRQQINEASDAFDSVEEYQIEGYAKYMTVPFCRVKGSFNTMESFLSEDMYPFEISGGGNIMYFFPLHFRERCFGYSIVLNTDIPITSMLFHTWIMNISTAIENVRKLNQLNDAIKKLDKLYVIDPLCEIYNRNGFVRSASKIFKECIVHHRKVMIMFIDMDGLKIINDEYSHKEGDFALKTLASILKSCCTNGEICARFGGDEFLIFSENFDHDMTTLLAEKINMKMKEVNNSINKPYRIDASIGCYVTEARAEFPLFSMITKADQKMYEEKKRKKTSRYLRRT
ncbi:MAG: GGDEF domain-containing protein [Oscillospiraceae bacterium]|nr:GGDEF domain-containing protein [Oscillospiraceae bacterium]